MIIEKLYSLLEIRLFTRERVKELFNGFILNKNKEMMKSLYKPKIDWDEDANPSIEDILEYSKAISKNQPKMESHYTDHLLIFKIIDSVFDLKLKKGLESKEDRLLTYIDLDYSTKVLLEDFYKLLLKEK